MVALSDIAPFPAVSRGVTVTVKDGDTVIAQRSIETSGVSGFSFNVPSSTTNATIEVDSVSHLKRRFYNVTLDGNPVQLGYVALANGDVDGSGLVDLTDLDRVIARYLTGAPGSPEDVDLSGEVDLSDLDIVITNYLMSDD